MMKENTEKMLTVTLTIDPKRHEKLKETSRVTRFSMSELSRIALDRFWNDLGDLNDLGPNAAKILFQGPQTVPVAATVGGAGKTKKK
jgi:hypothetical protein